MAAKNFKQTRVFKLAYEQAMKYSRLQRNSLLKKSIH